MAEIEKIEAPSNPEKPQRSIWISASVFIVLSIAVPYLLYTQLYDPNLSYDDIYASIEINYRGLLMILCLLVLYFLFDGLRLLFTLKSLNQTISLGSITPLVFINLCISNITPMATGGGIAQVLYLKNKGIKIGKATAATTLRTLQAVFFIFIPTPLLLLLYPAFNNTPLLDDIGVYLGIFAFLYVFTFFIIIFKSRWILALLASILNAFVWLNLVKQSKKKRLLYRLTYEVVHFNHGFRYFFTSNHYYLLLSLISTGAFLLCLFSFPAVIIYTLGYSVDYLNSLALLTVTTFIMYFSPSPGASGFAEGVFGVFFSQILPLPVLIVSILLWRFFTIYLGMIIGIPYTYKLFKGDYKHE